MAIDDAKIKLRSYFENACEILGVNLRNIPFVYDHIRRALQNSRRYLRDKW